MRLPRRRIVGAAVVVAVAAGGGAALAVNRTAADRPRSEREAFLADVAGRLGVSVDDLRRALREAAEARGWHGRGPFGPGRFRERPFGHGPGHAVRESFDAAAEYLDVTREQLFRRLMGGESLAGIAQAEGKSVDGLKQAIRDAVVKQLDAAVAAGRLTAAEQQELLSRLDTIIDDLVQRSRPPRGRHP